MGLIVYICDAGFPERIPEILRASGWEVSAAARRLPSPVAAARGSFAFEVRGGERVIHLSGGAEREGGTSFTMAVDGSLCARGYFGARRYYNAVERSLLKAGAREWTAADEVSVVARP